MTAGATFRITIEETGAVFAATAEQPILAAAEQAGLSLAHDCPGGICGTCRIRLIEGSVT